MEVTVPNPDNPTERRLPRLLDIAGVAEHLAVSERHVRRLVAERRIPYVKTQASVGAAALLAALRRQLIPRIRAEGFRQLRITGTRLSGARPGRTLDITIDLTEDPR
jgi:excisionase family DNA binding protein